MPADGFNRNKWAPRDETNFNAQTCTHKLYTFRSAPLGRTFAEIL